MPPSFVLGSHARAQGSADAGSSCLRLLFRLTVRINMQLIGVLLSLLFLCAQRLLGLCRCRVWAVLAQPE